MNARLSSSALLPIKTLVYLSCVLSTGCAFHNPKPTPPTSASTPASQPRTQRHEQPVVMSKPPANVPAQQKSEQSAKPAPPPPAIDKAPAANAPVAVTRPTPTQSGTTKAPTPAPTPSLAPSPIAKPAQPKPQQPKSEPSKPQTTEPKPHTPTTVTTASAIEPATPAAEMIAVDLNKLPLTIHGQWTLDRDESHCTLQSAIQQMDDGQGGTRVSLWLTTANEMHFVTESDIDLSYTGTGVTIDGGPHFNLETVEHRTNPVFSKQRSALLSAMKNAKTLELTLGFWPSWPVTHTYSASFPLQHFATAYAAWESCNTQLH